MSNPWDKDPKTKHIKNEEVTEHFTLDDFVKSKKGEKKPDSKKEPAPEPPPSVRMVTNDPLKNQPPSKEEALKNSQNEEGTTNGTSELGEILLRTTHLKREQLNEALQSQKESPEGDRIGDILVRKKLITEIELLKGMSIQLNIPIQEHLLKEKIDPELATKVPINFAKKYGLIPFKRERGMVWVALSNATDLSPMDDLRILLQANVKPVLASKKEILDAINRVYDQATKSHEDIIEDIEEQQLDNINLEETQDLLDSEDEAPIIRLVNTLLFRAVKERASDIHVEPFEKDLSVRFRIDGVMYEIMNPPKRAQASISSRIKIMAQLDIAEKRIPQDGRIKIKLAGRDIDIRVSTLPTSHGERIVMRLLDTSNVILSLEQLGFNERQLTVMNKIINKDHGIFLVTGPTGSGKTTTLYACLSRINTKEINVITVEDPVEIQLQGIGQIQVNPKVDLTFANGLRSILRQDPDVIMVGEIRDKETAEIAIQASLTGHLVFSTLHTNDAASSITRLVDMGVEPFLVSSSLVAVMAQRLIRRLCMVCRQPYTPTVTELQELNLHLKDLKGATIFRPKGCPECWNTGYRGRSGIYEILPIDDELRTLISKSSDGNAIKKLASSRGMRSLRDDGADRVLRGVTSIEEVLRVTQEEMAIE